MSKYLIVHFLDEVSEKTWFASSEWPLHLTIVPPFSTEAGANDLERILDAKTKKNFQKTIELEVSGPILLGPRHIPVMETSCPPELQALHESLVDRLDEAGVEHVNSRHIREGYRPHVTEQKGASAEPGRKIRMDSISLIGYPAEGQREVLKRFRFGTE